MSYIFTAKRFNNVIRLVLFLIIVFLISPNIIFSQTNEQKKDKKPDPRLHHEVKDDDYVPVSRDEQGRSPAYNYTMSTITTHQVNVDGNGQNIVGDAANEPSMAVDPNDRNKMVIGWRQFNTVTSNFRQNGYGYTTDGGQTWTFPGVITPGIFRSDPVLDYDVNGNFYYNSLTNDPDYYCKVFKSTNGGSSWDAGVVDISTPFGQVILVPVIPVFLHGRLTVVEVLKIVLQSQMSLPGVHLWLDPTGTFL
jgi:hypothetical protein